MANTKILFTVPSPFTSLSKFFNIKKVQWSFIALCYSGFGYVIKLLLSGIREYFKSSFITVVVVFIILDIFFSFAFRNHFM